MEFGIDEKGDLILIDELLTPTLHGSGRKTSMRLVKGRKATINNMSVITSTPSVSIENRLHRISRGYHLQDISLVP